MFKYIVKKYYIYANIDAYSHHIHLMCVYIMYIYIYNVCVCLLCTHMCACDAFPKSCKVVLRMQ